MKSTIPPHAKKVFEGIIFDIHQWEQELFDGTKTTFEIATRPSIVAIIATQGDRIFIAKEEQPGRTPYIALPAGFTEKHDTDSLTTAQRELREETGLTGTEWELFDSNDLYPRLSVSDYVYILRNAKRTHDKQLNAGERTLEEYWVTLDELIDIALDPTFMSSTLKHHLIRAKYDPSYKQTLEEKFFGYEKSS
jgi:ADP-ribose pyrophosphatase